MADSLGTGGTSGGGSFNLKRFVATPAFLVVALAIGLLLLYIWFSGRRQAAAAAQDGVVANPVTGPAEGPQVLGTLDTTGIQQQLGNILLQMSANNAAGSQPTHGQRITSGLGDTQPLWLHTQPNAESPVAALLRPGQEATAGSTVEGGTFTSNQLGITGNQWEEVMYGGSKYYAFLPEVQMLN